MKLFLLNNIQYNTHFELKAWLERLKHELESFQSKNTTRSLDQIINNEWY